MPAVDTDDVKDVLSKGKLPSGLADKKGLPEGIDLKQVEMGSKVEMEHTDDRDTAIDIALDHLAEIPDYYTRLKSLEEEAGKEGKKVGSTASTAEEDEEAAIEELYEESREADEGDGDDGIADLLYEESRGTPVPGNQENRNQIEASSLLRTGIQWLAEAVFPGFLAGIIGRWLLTKMFDILDSKKIIPPRIVRWLKKPMHREDLIASEPEVKTALARCPDLGFIIDNIEPDSSADAYIDNSLAAKTYLRAFVEPLRMLPDHLDVENAKKGCESFLPVSEGTQVITAVLPGSEPSENRFPRGINPSAKAVWEAVLRDFSDEIDHLGKGDNLRKWTVAILLFQRMCERDGVEPFVKGIRKLSPYQTGSETKERKRLVSKLNKAERKGSFALRVIEDKVRAAFPAIGVQEKFKYHDPIYSQHRNEYQILWYSFWDTQQLDRAGIKSLKSFVEDKLGFIPGSVKYYKIGKEGYRITYQQKRDGGLVLMCMPLTPTEAMLLAGTRKEEEILPQLTRLSRKWFIGSALD